MSLSDLSENKPSGREDAPINMFQFWDHNPPAEVVSLMSTWQAEPGVNYRLFNNETAEDYIRERIGLDACMAYRACNVGAMKADFFRYCALYEEGGVYIDADTQNLGGLSTLYDPTSKGLFFVRNSKLANDFMIICRPHEYLMQYAIDKAIQNINQKLSNNVWEVTGPGILTALYRSEDPEKVRLFEDYVILPVTEIRKVVGFKWDLPYKQDASHWVAYQTEQRSIFKTD
ncbi:glycosyltransferase family 32 protein [Microbaculum marinum]|uniref:Glycosyltransferase n=1 Tax=Microbaculum marinum TaxID=1764581 RepID=A0AAW9RP29_9HYPH